MSGSKDVLGPGTSDDVKTQVEQSLALVVL